MNELFKIDMDKREIILNYKHYNVNVDILNYIVDLLKQLEAYENMRKEAIDFIKKHQRKDEFLNLNEWQTRDLLNILNKVGSDK